MKVQTPRALFAMLALALIGMAPACSQSIAPPSAPPAYDQPAPAMVEGPHARHSTTRTINADAATVRTWIEQGRMMEVLNSTPRVSKPASADMLAGVWPQEGAVRRVRQEDGHYVAERIVSRNAEGFVYQIWAPTTAAGRNILYGRCEFRVTAREDGRSDLTWTYALKAKHFWAQPFVDAFVRDHFAPFMEAGMDAFAASAAAPAKASVLEPTPPEGQSKRP